MNKKLKRKGSKLFNFNAGDYWDGDECIIEWIMDKLNVSCGDSENMKVKKKTYFHIHCVQEEVKDD